MNEIIQLGAQVGVSVLFIYTIKQAAQTISKAIQELSVTDDIQIYEYDHETGSFVEQPPHEIVHWAGYKLDMNQIEKLSISQEEIDKEWT